VAYAWPEDLRIRGRCTPRASPCRCGRTAPRLTHAPTLDLVTFASTFVSSSHTRSRSCVPTRRAAAPMPSALWRVEHDKASEAQLGMGEQPAAVRRLRRGAAHARRQRDALGSRFHGEACRERAQRGRRVLTGRRALGVRGRPAAVPVVVRVAAPRAASHTHGGLAAGDRPVRSDGVRSGPTKRRRSPCGWRSCDAASWRFAGRPGPRRSRRWWCGVALEADGGLGGSAH
jgi:hypothetical protein